MHHFADFVLKPYIRRFGYKRILEIGAQYGENTDSLAALPSVHVTVIDPCIDTDLCVRHAQSERVKVHRGLSLDVLADMFEPFDCILIDGDHNWYTLYYELWLIRERSLLVRGGTIFLHDTSWPYARRDGYYEPQRIPEAYRQPYAYKGIVRGRSELSDSEGVNRNIANANHEGGPRNGVLCAVEDFVREHEHKYLFFNLELQFGLGLLYRRRDSETDAIYTGFCKQLRRRLRVSAMKGRLQSAFPRAYAAVRRAVVSLRTGRRHE